MAGVFTEFAVTVGFRSSPARLMTGQKLRGTAVLLESTERSPVELCREVMTPGETTERGVCATATKGLGH
ncbi:pyrroline-5-carboxylate reductase dimerization domain-containing protein [Pseudonocardia alaniniphila]|uniref:pyrroline-5-carboxylate reductase dimerization domain-containing protein n=1 Tax=Pseudonocardia alaniniphila TaxID=75291 RepID=UPI003641CD88